MTMLPVKRILCPTDFSDASFEGLKVANQLADHFSSELILVHVVSPIPVYAGANAPPVFHIPDLMKNMKDSAKNLLKEVLREKIPENIETRIQVRQGKPADQIADSANTLKADLIVMATRGESRWKRFISGSVTERVVRLSNCPVLTIPETESEAE
jgi:universal stress protein A